MIDKLIAFSARNGFIVVLLIVAITGGGVWAIRQTPIDAIPDLSDVQVIISANWEGRSPTLVEDQVTYPIVTALLSAPHVKVVRGFSYFDVAFVYVIFEDGTDPYWARSRVLEYSTACRAACRPGSRPFSGPMPRAWAGDSSMRSSIARARHDLARLRTLNDWYVQYRLRSVPGVAEVAPVGGYVKQYQVEIDPNALVAYGMSIDMVSPPFAQSNNDVGGRVVEWTGREYMVRGRGYLTERRGHRDGEPRRQTRRHARSSSRTWAACRSGSEMRRGVADLNGEGDVAGGIVVIRSGVDTYSVIENIKTAVKGRIQPALPEGVEFVTTYDRSELIERSIATCARS